MGWAKSHWIVTQAATEADGKSDLPTDDESVRGAIVRTRPMLIQMLGHLFVANSQLSAIKWTLYLIALLLAYIGYRLT